MKEFAVAYEVVFSLSQKEAEEKLSILRKYFLSLEGEISGDFFKELMVSAFGISERDFSLVDDQGMLFIHLYNLTLRKAKGKDLVKDEEKEYTFYQRYRDLLKQFPEVNIDHYGEEVIKFFALRHKEMIKEMVEKEGLKERFSRCKARPRLGKGRGGYLTVKCYSDVKRDRAVAQGKEDYILPLYALAVAYYYAGGEDV